VEVPIPPRHRSLLAAFALALAGLLLGAGPCARHSIAIGIPDAAGRLAVQVELPAAADPTLASVALDGVDVTSDFAPGGSGLLGSLALPSPGPHVIAVVAPRDPADPAPFAFAKHFPSPAATPALLAANPAAGATAVPRTAWLRFAFAAPPGPSALIEWGFALECNGTRVSRLAHALPDGVLILNPTPELPPAASCRVLWRDDGGGLRQHLFATAADLAPAAEVHYDRANPLRVTPFPDDYWTVADASQPTGLRIEPPVPPFDDPFQQEVFTALVTAVGPLDGWSRQPPIVISFSHPLDPSAVPADETASLDPFAPIALVDVDPASPDHGRRIPYRLLRRSDPAPDGTTDREALIFPAIDLRERGRYAVVVTTRAFAQFAPGRPLRPSAFFAALLAPPAPGESSELARARASIEPTLAALATLPDVPIPPEDVALAFRLTIRTHPDVSDLVAIKELALASPPPPLLLPDPAVNACPNPASSCILMHPDRALEVRGKVRLPNYRDPLKQIVRDPLTGRPVQTGTADVPFVLTLPLQALDGPVLPVMYQHGNPGSANEVADGNQEALDDAGFAVLGFTDALNREFGQDISLQTQATFFVLLQAHSLPANWLQTTADQIHFLRAIQGMGALDLLRRAPGGGPEVGPDGVPEIDPSTLLYKGISEGANHAQRFLPFAPELLAAEATVGGARLAETLIHQDPGGLIFSLRQFLPQLRAVELWVGLSLFQAALDPQDGHTYLRHLYRQPLLPFAGSSDVVPPSTLWTEGVGDSWVPNNASRAMAVELGIPHVRPVVSDIPDLPQVDAPLSGNLGPGVTAGYFQILPETTPWCVANFEGEPHFCAQSASELLAQRLHFLLTALGGSPEIVNPF
jgi:hypothetical protein